MNGNKKMHLCFLAQKSYKAQCKGEKQKFTQTAVAENFNW